MSRLATIELAQSIIIRMEVASDPKTFAKLVPTSERGQFGLTKLLAEETWSTFYHYILGRPNAKKREEAHGAVKNQHMRGVVTAPVPDCSTKSNVRNSLLRQPRWCVELPARDRI